MLFEKFNKAYQAGKKVTDPTVVTLGKEANTLVREFTGDDPEMLKSFQTMYKTEGGHNILAQQGVEVSAEVFQYLSQAMKEAKSH